MQIDSFEGAWSRFWIFFPAKKSFDDNWWTLFSSIKQFWNLFDFMNFNAVFVTIGIIKMNSFHALKFTYFREFIYVCHVAKKSLPRHLDIVAWLIAPLWLKDTEKGNVVIINYSCVSKWAYDELTLFEKRRTTFFVTKVVFFHSTILHFLVQVLRELLIVTKNYAAVTRKPLCQKATKTIHLSGRKKYCTYSGKVLPQKNSWPKELTTKLCVYST